MFFAAAIIETDYLLDFTQGLTDAVQTIFPSANQRYCLFHIEANFKLKFRGGDLADKMWNVGKACDLRSYEDAMKSLKEDNCDAHDWLEKIPKKLWCRHAWDPVSRVGHVTNNVAESLNSWINDYREFPILSLLEEYRLKVMKRLHSRFQRACQWKGKLVPDTVKKINKEWASARSFEVFAAGKGEYQCRVGSRLYVVNLTNRTCDCRRWEVTGIPCMHAIACIRMCNEEVEDYCHVAYTVDRYFAVYSNIIHPQPDLGILPMPTEDIMQPPPLRRLPGRPRKARRMQPSEKMGTQRSTTLRCSICKAIGHNKRSCQGAPVGSNPVKLYMLIFIFNYRSESY